MLVNRICIVHLWGTIFRCGLIHIWRSSEHLRQQDGVFGIKSKYTTVPMFMVMKKHVTQSNSMAHWCVFNSFFFLNMELWRNKTDQASATQTILFVFASVSSWDLLKIRKIYSLFKLISTLQLECKKDKSIDVQNFAAWFTFCPLFVCGCFPSFLESHHIPSK